MLKKLLNNAVSQHQADRRAEAYRNLIRREAQVGGQLFGPVPKGHRRQFFCLDKHTWIWHEEWTEAGSHQIRTTRYDIRPDVILKSQDGHHYQRLTMDEVKNFVHAVGTYRQRIAQEVYSLT